MNNEKLLVKVVTPNKDLYFKEVEKLSVETDQGFVTIMPHHNNYMANVVISILTTVTDGVEKHFAIGGGAINMQNATNTCVLILNSIDHVSELDLTKLQEERKLLEEKINSELSVEERKEAEISLKRTIVQAFAKSNYQN